MDDTFEQALEQTAGDLLLVRRFGVDTQSFCFIGPKPLASPLGELFLSTVGLGAILLFAANLGYALDARVFLAGLTMSALSVFVPTLFFRSNPNLRLLLIIIVLSVVLKALTFSALSHPYPDKNLFKICSFVPLELLFALPLMRAMRRGTPLCGLKWDGQSSKNYELVGLHFVRFNFESSTFLDLQIDGCTFEECNLFQCDLSGVRMTSSKFTHSDLSECNLSASNFSNCDFRSCDMKSGSLESTKMVGCDFVDCDMTSIDLGRAKVYSTNFRKSNLERANLESAHFGQNGPGPATKLGSANLTGVIYNSETDWPGDVIPSLIRDSIKK